MMTDKPQTSRSQLQTSDRQLQTGSLLLCNLCEFSRFTSYCQYPNKHFPLQSQQEKHKKTRKKCEICSKLTIKTPYVIDIVLVSSLFIWTDFGHSPGVSIADFEKVNAVWMLSQSSTVDTRPKLKVNMTFLWHSNYHLTL